jgi:6-phosphofructokinase 1
MAGPRRTLYFDSPNATCAVVTCGGLCPGLNDVIRSLVLHAYHRYGVRRFLGIPFGFEGLILDYSHEIENLTPALVANIHQFGGSYLGSSRGPQSLSRMMDRLGDLGVDILFVIGGDGTLRGGLDLFREASKRGRSLSVVGIPKTIDNDIMYIDKSFGYETAFSHAVRSVNCAHVEARGVNNGLGLVKLMGRHSGFIACSAAIATGDVNYVLIPEVPFELEGANGLFENLRRRMRDRKHAVIVVAEGAGQELMNADGNDRDASGNVRLGDIGVFLKDKIQAYFDACKIELNVKYIDPSYMIRSVPADPQDRVFCQRLAQAAVHAAMAGKTGMVVGRWHGRFIHLPIEAAVSSRRTVDPCGDLWNSVLEATGQPPSMCENPPQY